jgi:hypothetical protein
MPLALAAAMSFAGVVVIGVRAKRLRLIEVAACAGLFVVAVGISVLAVGVVWNTARGLLERTGVSWQKRDVPILSGFAVLTAMLTLVLARCSGSRRSLTGVCLGAFSWWMVLSLATAHWLPGASYLFVWPTLFGLLGLCVSILSRPDSVKAAVAAALCSLPSLLLLPPLISVVFDVLSAGMTAPIVVFLVLMVPIVSLIVLFLGTMVPILGPLIAHGPGHEHPSLGGKA